MGFVGSERRFGCSLTAWFDEELKNTMLKDRLELLVPQPEYLTSPPPSLSRDPEAETLAPYVSDSDQTP